MVKINTTFMNEYYISLDYNREDVYFPLES